MKNLKLIFALIALGIMYAPCAADAVGTAYHSGYPICLVDDNNVCWRCAGTPDPTNNCTGGFNGASCTNSTSGVKPIGTVYYKTGGRFECTSSGWQEINTEIEEECDEKETYLWTPATALGTEHSPGALVNVACADCDCNGYNVSASHSPGYVHYQEVEVACLPGWYNPRIGGGLSQGIYLCDECPKGAICPGGYEPPVCGPGECGDPLTAECTQCPNTSIYSNSSLTSFASVFVSWPGSSNPNKFLLRNPLSSHDGLDMVSLRVAVDMGLLVVSSDNDAFVTTKSIAGGTTVDSCYIKGETIYYDASGAFKFSSDCYYK